jgi:hypothetical protein
MWSGLSRRDKERRRRFKLRRPVLVGVGERRSSQLEGGPHVRARFRADGMQQIPVSCKAQQNVDEH